MFAKTIIRQGEKIIKLDNIRKQLEKKNAELEFKNFDTNRECLNLIGMLDDAQEEFLHILDNIEEILSNNDCGQPDIKVRKALEEIRYQKEIIEKDLEINNELSTTLDGNR